MLDSGTPGVDHPLAVAASGPAARRLDSTYHSTMPGIRADSVLFASSAALLFLVPLAFSTYVHRTSTLPKFAFLLGGAAIVLCGLVASAITRRISLSKLAGCLQVRLMILFLMAIGLSAAAGEAPAVSLFGSHLNQMGFLTHLCFFVVYLGLIAGIGVRRSRLTWTLWAITLTGLLAGAYATAQFFGKDPFLPASSYTFESLGEQIIRPPGPFGHPDVLGNFLVYTWPVSLALARLSDRSPRRIALAGCGFSLLGILLSGTRGAWLGALAGACSVVILEARSRPRGRPRLKMIGVSFAVAIALLLVAGLLSPVRQAVFSRVRELIAEGAAGAGRFYLWRDALKMAPRYSIIGCGQDAFSKAFPPYRSEELARYSAGVSNESSHNMYLDVAITHGLPGALIYLAILASALRRLYRSRDFAEPGERVIYIAIAASITGAAVHHLFMYDQISTGLYFYAFIALALTATTGVDSRRGGSQAPRAMPRAAPVFWNWIAMAAALMSVAASIWYAVSLIRSDRAVKKAHVAANRGDVDALERYCRKAAASPDPTDSYGFAAAQAALAFLTRTSSERGSVVAGAADSSAIYRALALGRAYAERSLAKSVTPGDNNVLLGYFALRAGDTVALRRHTAEAVRWDPFNISARWLMAESLLAQGDREGASGAARVVLEISPGFGPARSVLIRARAESEMIERMVQRSNLVFARGNVAKAERLLKRALRLSEGRCDSCYRELALLFERTGRNEEAVREWRRYVAAAPEQARSEDVASRIVSLEKKRK
jgi:Tfp pilus assembly protein PilF